jgi:hypothetical protein
VAAGRGSRNERKQPTVKNQGDIKKKIAKILTKYCHFRTNKDKQ